MQSFRTSFGLNLLEDLACSSSPLTVRNLMDLVTSSDFSSGHAIEFLQWYVICCLAWSLNNWRNSSWLGSDTYSSFEWKDKVKLVFWERQSGRAASAGLAIRRPRVQVDPPWPLPGFVHGSSEFKSSALLVNNQLVCLRPVGILNPVKFDLNYSKSSV